MVRSVNSMPVFNRLRTQAVTPQNVGFRGDKNTQNPTPKVKKSKDPTEVGLMRAIFSRLTDEQIKKANETGKVSGKIKIKPKQNMTGYLLVPNYANITTGTQTIPEGYELRKNILGFTCLLPKDSEGMFIKKK